MRLDHLLSKENVSDQITGLAYVQVDIGLRTDEFNFNPLRNKSVSTLVSKSRYIALFDFEDAETGVSRK